MANYTGSNVAVKYGSNVMTANTLTLSGVAHDAVLEDVTPFGVSDQVMGYAGLKKGKPVTVEGLFDDTASTGADAVFGGAVLGTSAALLLTWGGSKTTSFTAFSQSYERLPSVGKFVRFRAVLQPSAAWTEA